MNMSGQKKTIEYCNTAICNACIFGTFEDVLNSPSPVDGMRMVDHPDLDKERLVKCALDTSSLDLLEFLMGIDAAPFIKKCAGRHENRCIKMACRTGDIDMVKFLMDPDKGGLITEDILCEKQSNNHMYQSALFYATWHNCVDIIQFFALNGFITQHAAQKTLDDIGLNNGISNCSTGILKELANPRVKGATG